jgi:hypothetical protein
VGWSTCRWSGRTPASDGAPEASDSCRGGRRGSRARGGERGGGERGGGGYGEAARASRRLRAGRRSLRRDGRWRWPYPWEEGCCPEKEIGGRGEQVKLGEE